MVGSDYGSGLGSPASLVGCGFDRKAGGQSVCPADPRRFRQQNYRPIHTFPPESQPVQPHPEIVMFFVQGW